MSYMDLCNMLFTIFDNLLAWANDVEFFPWVLYGIGTFND